MDYIIEKFWRNSLLVGAVLVVLGFDRVNYERFVFRGVFIYVDDFFSVSFLVVYLFFFDRNSVVYRRYFYWRRSYVVYIIFFWDEFWCRVC